jgi:hypothetical protein
MDKLELEFLKQISDLKGKDDEAYILARRNLKKYQKERARFDRNERGKK